MPRCVVLIPIYKSSLSFDEEASLRQCVCILGQHPIVLVCPEGLDVSRYEIVAGKTLPRKCFDPRYFESVEGYSELLLKREFYESFSTYEYMLIHQLDAWVFEDALFSWCDKGYDYIGAPWFYQNKSHEEGFSLWLVGNGGFSLRRVSKFLEITAEGRIIRFSLRHLFCKDMFHKWYRRLYLRNLSCFSGSNLPSFIKGFYKPWEDLVFCHGLRGSNLQLYVPSPKKAALFSIEVSPEYLYTEVNRRVLPFGCHAWRKYQYEDFWSKFILIDEGL